jgi:hypothetical protein
MKHSAVITLCLALLMGCQASGIRGYWDAFPLLEKDLSLSEDRFARFAELAVAAPQDQALAAMDILFDKLKQDTVAYYVYSEWVDGAFYNLLSPCRSVPLYNKAVERMVSDSVLQLEECEPFLQRREWMQFNQPGAPATVPGRNTFPSRTLVLVLDLSCPSCRQALERLSADPQWAEARHLAVCCGSGPLPTVSGWEYLSPENATAVFDPHLSPIYFVVAAGGVVERGYTPALE